MTKPVSILKKIIQDCNELSENLDKISQDDIYRLKQEINLLVRNIPELTSDKIVIEKIKELKNIKPYIPSNRLLKWIFKSYLERYCNSIDDRDEFLAFNISNKAYYVVLVKKRVESTLYLMQNKID